MRVVDVYLLQPFPPDKERNNVFSKADFHGGRGGNWGGSDVCFG